MLQYLQAEFAEHLGITMNIRVMPIQDWMQAMLNKENNLFLAPYELTTSTRPTSTASSTTAAGTITASRI